MSLFIQLAHSRPGAERLLEANVVSVLGRCDYLDARPEGDQDFMGEFYFCFQTLHLTSNLARSRSGHIPTTSCPALSPALYARDRARERHSCNSRLQACFSNEPGKRSSLSP